MNAQIICKPDGKIAAEPWIGTVICAGCPYTVRVPPGIAVEQIGDAQTDFAQPVLEESFTYVEVAETRPVVETSIEASVLSPDEIAGEDKAFPENNFKGRCYPVHEKVVVETSCSSFLRVYICPERIAERKINILTDIACQTGPGRIPVSSYRRVDSVYHTWQAAYGKTGCNTEIASDETERDTADDRP